MKEVNTMEKASIVKEKPKVVKLKDGGIVFGEVEEITSRAVGAERANFTRVTLFGPDVIHTHERTEETYIYKSGMGKIILGNKIYDFGPDTRVIIPPGTPHAAKPYDSFPQFVFLCVSSPPFDPDDVHSDPRGRNW